MAFSFFDCVQTAFEQGMTGFIVDEMLPRISIHILYAHTLLTLHKIIRGREDGPANL